MKPVLLVLIHISAKSRAVLESACLPLGLELLLAPDRAARDEVIANHGARVRAVLSNGSTGLNPEEIDVMPALTLVGALGAGHENIAMAHARQRGSTVVTGAGTNVDAVADHALALLLAAVRGLRQQDMACRSGIWRDALPLYGQLAGKRVGILGLGMIGRKIAQRVSAFDAELAYHNRRPRSDSALPYFDRLQALAEWADHLVIATPGGSATHHLVGGAVLGALGPKGCLVNIARGSVVDSEALVGALQAGQIGGVGLDVYETEPEPPTMLLDFPNVLLTPHVAGWSPEAIGASFDLFAENLRRHLSGEPVLTPL